jgi:ABC-type polysaccharide/polyol phosphate transport system ATPase subunit
LRATDKTIVFVSHDLATMKRYCDRALFLQGGLVQGIGPVEDVVELYVPELLSELG